MNGTLEEPIQIDESLFAGRRKYRRGRLASGDKNPPGERAAHQAFEEELAQTLSDDTDCSEDELGGRVCWRTNYGRRVRGPWVLGLSKSKNEVRFYIIPDRSG